MSEIRKSDPQERVFKKIIELSRSSTPGNGVVQYLLEQQGVDFCSIMVHSIDSNELLAQYHSTENESRIDEKFSLEQYDFEKIMGSNKSLLITKDSKNKQIQNLFEDTGFDELMLFANTGRQIRLITLIGSDDGSAALKNNELISVFETIFVSSEWILELLFEHDYALQLTLKDDLTKAYNRRYLKTELKSLLVEAEKKKWEVALIFFDLNDFREANDRYGHYFGSMILRGITSKIMEKVRELDRLVRFGGDEFCVVLPQTTEQGAKIVAERILETIKSIDFETPDGRKLKVSASFGIASFPKHAKTDKDLICEADRAMYAAKEGDELIKIIDEEISKKMAKRHIDV